MGCHTWAYRGLKEEEIEGVRKSVVDALTKDFKYVPDGKNIEEYIKERCKSCRKVYTPEEISDADVERMIRKGNKKIRELLKKLEENPKDVRAMFEASNYELHSCTFVLTEDKNHENPELYTQCGFDVPVRIYGYPEDSFTDPDEFIEWVKKREEELGHAISEYYVYDIDGTKNAVRGYTPDMETIVKNYWANYGGKVLLNFG